MQHQIAASTAATLTGGGDMDPTDMNALAQGVGAEVASLVKQGFTLEQIADGINSRMAALGLPCHVTVETIAGVKGLNISLPAPKPGAMAKCPGPHYAAPCCGAEICFEHAVRGHLPIEKLHPYACCPKCTSFLGQTGASYDAMTFRCLSLDDVVELPDDVRNELIRERQQYEQERRPRGRMQ